MVESFGVSEFSAYLLDFERAISGLHVAFDPPLGTNAIKFFRGAVLEFDRTLNKVLSICKTGNVHLSPPVRRQAQDFLDRLPARSERDTPALIEHARLTRQAILHDLEQRRFLYLDDSSSSFYEAPLAGWGRVIDRFGCSFDVEEGRKCLALGRYTASVFHLMKVVEAAVLELQMFLDKTDHKAHFGSVLMKLEKLTQDTKFDELPPHLQPHKRFMADTLTQLHAVKDSWRDKVTHVDSHIVPIETFTPELARGVHDAVLMLMNKLAEGLPPRPGGPSAVPNRVHDPRFPSS